MKTILVTGFEPFGGESVNPSWECVRTLPDNMNASDIVRACLPVEWDRTNAALGRLIDEVQPDAVISFGQAGGRNAVTIERIAMNLRDSASPDNVGRICCNEPVVPGGPDGIFATLPVYGIKAALEDARIPAAFSYSAGPYLCNNAMYYALYRALADGSAMKAGFVHVPYMNGQSQTAFTMDIEQMRRAALTICGCVSHAIA